MLDNLWAKYSPERGTYPLLCHLLDTACAAELLAEEWLREGLKEFLREELGPRWKQVVALSAALHDLGKTNAQFQGQLSRSKAEVPWARQVLSGFPSSQYGRPDPGMPAPRELCRHEVLSFLHFCGPDLFEVDAEESWLGQVALGHHGLFRILEPDFAEYAHEVTGGGWADLREELISMVEAGVGIRAEQAPSRLGVVPTILLSGLTVLADRLASGDEWVAAQQDRKACGEIDEQQPARWLEKSRERMRRRLREQLGIYEPLKDPREAILRRHEPRGAQRRMESVGRGLVTVMAPTGSGKTEAALLRHELENERLAFLLPTTATTNAIMRRVQAIYEGTNNIASLAHGLASIEDFYVKPMEDSTRFGAGSGGAGQASPADEEMMGGLHPSDFSKSGSGRLLAAITVGTIDQGLMASLPLKWTHLRLLALANSHVVVDEVHTLDAFQSELLCGLLRWLGRLDARVTLLSATVPSGQLQSFISAYQGQEGKICSEFPSVLEVPSSRAVAEGNTPADAELSTALQAPNYRITYDLVSVAASAGWEGSNREHIDWAEKVRESNPRSRIGIFVNQIQRAQQIGEALEKRGERVFVLHSRMTAQHRAEVAKRINAALGVGGIGHHGLTLVGTQAIEASLDIDLDIASTDIAPAPSIIQRAGRVWRRPDDQRALRINTPNLHLHIVSGGMPGWRLPYPDALITRSLRWLENHKGEIVCPDDIQDFVEAAWVDLDSLMSDEDSEYMAAFLQAAERARSVCWDLAEVEKRHGYSRLAPLTAHAAGGGGPLSARLVERVQTQLILCDSQGLGVPGALPMSALEAARSDQSWTQKKIRSYLAAGLATSASKIVNVVQQQGVKLEGGLPGVLRGRYLVDISEALTYRPTVGLMLA